MSDEPLREGDEVRVFRGYYPRGDMVGQPAAVVKVGRTRVTLRVAGTVSPEQFRIDGGGAVKGSDYFRTYAQIEHAGRMREAWAVLEAAGLEKRLGARVDDDLVLALAEAVRQFGAPR